MISTLLVDLDGTLTDPKPGITRCIQYALEELGRRAPAADDLAWCIGPPLRESFMALLGDDSAENADRALALYRQRFADVGMYENEVYAEVPEIFAAQRSAGRRLYVASAKPSVYVVPILRHFELAPIFDGVYGSELDGTRSDKRHLLDHLLQDLGIDAGSCMMIGDRHHDIEAAKSVGASSVWVDWGYGSADERDASQPDHICRTPAQLRELLATL